LAEVDSDDLCQEVLAVVVREVPHFHHNGQPGAFRRWLKNVTINRLRGLWRSRQGEARATGDSDFVKMLDQLEDPDSLLSHLWDQEHDRHLARRLLQMAEPDFEPTTWQAFRRVALEEARAADVAAELGLSINAVLLAKSRVLRRLRQEVEGLLD
jgi:RNA polymerase sigma-70 factor (ECF subfamily)